jgi:serine/threonine-protein kinase
MILVVTSKSMTVTGTETLGSRYTLTEVLGTGGMATVWRARDEVLGREVAVKVLSPQYAADPGFLTRFEREARHAASVSSPRLVTVFDSGIDEGTPFLVMELVTGRTLRQVLAEASPLPVGQAVAIAAAVCEGLDAAHAAGLVHRDITPANIMLAGEDVKILDFGIARADGTAAGTLTGTILGTAAYLSPEQSAGYPAGPQSDLYSLGCVLFEMLTGTPPFTAESPVGIAYRQVHDDPGPPSARRPGLSPSLDAITARLLAKNPNDRPMSAAAARTGLLAALAPGGTAVLPVPPGTVPDRARQRRRLRWSETVLAVTLAAALLALTVTLLIGGGSPSPPATPAARDSQASQPRATPTATSPTSPTSALPPVAAAAAALVGDLQAGVSDGQVSQQAGQNMFNQLQQLLFAPPGQGTQQTQNQYDQLAQAYTQYKSQGDITGEAAVDMPKAISALGDALGVL